MPSLRRIVLDRTGQDLRLCQCCNICDEALDKDADIPISSLVQLILLNDEEVLTCRTLWSDSTLAKVRKSCNHGFNLPSVLLALRTEAQDRGYSQSEPREEIE